MSFRRPRHSKTNENGHSANGTATKPGTGEISAVLSNAEIKAKEQLIQLMSQVNAAVKNGDFNSHLANNIFQLCLKLKQNGQHLEHNHEDKERLNKVFSSLRQACCRDNGQLGTPCRLKVMELIELRAMGWRPNMAHSQYYLSRAESASESSTPLSGPPPPPVPSHKPSQHSPPNHQNQNQSQNLHTHNHNFHQFQPIQQYPPFVAQQPIFDQSGQPGYFLISTNGWGPGMVPMVPQFQQQPMMRPDWMRQNAVAAAVQAHFSQNERMMGSSMNSKSCKQPQLREEITIRNADSGKIMGVKGRRVAVVEEMSKTVISFQKVEHNSKYRVLAISGSTMESIQHAKRLIEETIKRNVSPNRIENLDNSPAPSNNIPDIQTEEPEEEEEEPDISIETGKDGSLKVSCADPEMLEAAQAALREYINLRTNKLSAREREERKDRRKSMPIQSGNANEANAAKENVVVKSVEEGSVPISNGILKAHGSTPNLMAESIQTPKPTKLEPFSYNRTKMLAIRQTVNCTEGDGPLVDSARALSADAQRNDPVDQAQTPTDST